MNRPESDESLQRWMKEALDAARSAAERNEVPVGALFVNAGQVIGRGANRREETKRTVAHAEIVALEDYNQRTGQWRLPAKTLLVVTAEPCLMCTGALVWARVESIFYGCSDPRDAGIRKVLPLVDAGTFDHRFTEVRGGLLGEECGRLMTSFFQRKRRNAKTESTD
jgi:tRNA(adenine34) deaminase